MKTIFIVFISFILFFAARAQTILDKERNAILARGLELYELESASWHSTDLVREGYGLEGLSGYLSYREGSTYNTIFLKAQTDKEMQVAYTVSYRDSARRENAQVSKQVRELSEHERQLWNIRGKAAAEIQKDQTFFKHYKDSQLNLAFVEDNHKILLYILSGTPKSGVIPIGNDYLLTFNKRGKLLSREALHKSLLFLPIEESSAEKEGGQFFHSYLPEYSPYITPTDICTMLLYAP